MWTTTSRSCWRNGKLPYSLWDRNNKIIFLTSSPPPPPLPQILKYDQHLISYYSQPATGSLWIYRTKWSKGGMPRRKLMTTTFSSHWYTLISHGHLFAGQYYCLQLHCTTQNAVLCLSQSSLPLPYKSFIACVQEHLEIYLQVFYTQAIMFKYISFSISFFFLSHQASLHLFLRCLKHRNYLMN